MPGAEYNSAARDPPPRCHPNSRLDILVRILEWISMLERKHKLVWIKGSAGIGKSAIVQTLAEVLTDVLHLAELLSDKRELADVLSNQKKLGAALFFSRPNSRSNPSLVFPTVAFQLAVQIPSYRTYLEAKMLENPKILEASIKHQFRILISDPFSSMREDVVGAFVILLDGLDECHGDDNQVLLFTLVSQFSHDYPHSPLVWCIASRPEAHLMQAFTLRNTTHPFWTEDIPSDTTRACADVEKFLRTRFAEIQQRYPDIIPAEPTWPSETALTKICGKAEGHFGFASILAQFVEDPVISDPVFHLEIVLSVVSTRILVDPLSALHALYTQILDNVPKILLPTLKLVLGHCLWGWCDAVGGDMVRSLVLTATLFNLQQSGVYAALRKLHSIIKVPSPIEFSKSLEFHHASFSDYLCNSSLSGEYVLDLIEYRARHWRASVAFLQKYADCESFLDFLTRLLICV
jgi:hypothetical protein